MSSQNDLVLTVFITPYLQPTILVRTDNYA